MNDYIINVMLCHCIKFIMIQYYLGMKYLIRRSMVLNVGFPAEGTIER